MIQKIQPIDKPKVKSFFISHWGSSEMIVNSGVYQCDALDGFMWVEGNDIIGLITYIEHTNHIEIISLDSLSEGKGIGTSLINEVERYAVNTGISKIVLHTTNDNIHALSFYQKRGYRINAVICNAANIARTKKPTIPFLNEDHIPIADELILEKQVIRSEHIQWRHLSIENLTALLNESKIPYGIAGGFGIELFVGNKIRHHDDIDVLVLDDDVLQLVFFLRHKGYQLYKAKNGVLSPLTQYDSMDDSFSIWVSENINTPFIFEILLGRTNQSHWIYRRNETIQLPIDKVFLTKQDYYLVNPFIILLFKLDKEVIEAKNLQDYNAIKPLLKEADRQFFDGLLEDKSIE